MIQDFVWISNEKITRSKSFIKDVDCKNLKGNMYILDSENKLISTIDIKDSNEVNQVMIGNLCHKAIK